MSKDLTNWYDAMDVALQTGTTTESVMQEARLDKAAPTVLPSKVADLQKQRDALAKKQTELEHREAEIRAAVQQWESLLTKRKDLQRELHSGQAQFEEIRDSIPSRIGYLHEQCWGQDRGNHHLPVSIVDLYGRIAGCERAVQDFPNWKQAKEQELAAVESELIAFAKRHNITDKLGDDLKARL